LPMPCRRQGGPRSTERHGPKGRSGVAMDSRFRYVFESRSAPATPEQFAGNAFGALVPGAEVCGAFTDLSGGVRILWRVPPQKISEVPHSTANARREHWAWSGPSGPTRLGRSEVSPRTLAWLPFELDSLPAHEWASRWDGGFDQTLERVGAQLLAVFVGSEAGSRRSAILVAGHRPSDLDTAWERFGREPAVKARLAGPARQGFGLSRAVRLNPLPWSPVQ
jgi:hypothetical protein